MIPRTINSLSHIAAQLRVNYGIFSEGMSAEEVCVKFARRICDSCLPEDDILMLVRMSDDSFDFRDQLADWAKSSSKQAA